MEVVEASESTALEATTTTAAAGLNPLEVPLILENIFNFLGSQDLIVCRQVSKLWNTCSKKPWNASCPVRITSGKGPPAPNATQFANFVRKRGMGYRRSLYTNFTVSGAGGTKPFWNVCGPNIRVLCLHRCQFASMDDFRNVVYKLCPSMKELKLESVPVYVKGEPVVNLVEPTQWTVPEFGEHKSVTSLTSFVYEGSIPVSWMELLSHFPKLKVLNLEGTLATDPGYGGELFKSLALIRQRNPTDLKVRNPRHSVCFWSEFLAEDLPPELVAGVRDSKLHLESLFVCMSGPNTLADLRSIFISNASSLKKLHLYRHSNNRNPVQVLDQSFHSAEGGIQLTGLQEIDLDSEAFASLTFLRFTPNLKKLSLTGTRQTRIVENTNMVEMEGVVLGGVTELNIEGEISTEDLRKLIVLMPNVTKFRMRGMNDAQTHLVREYWPNVRD